MPKIIGFFLLLVLFTGCDDIYSRPQAETNTTVEDNTTEDNTTDEVNTTIVASQVIAGVFVDSPVEGIQFATFVPGTNTAVLSGVTDSQGFFYYHEGETIKFTLGYVNLCNTITAKTLITPLDICSGSSDITEDREAVNMSRFFQSLDEDANASNGIKINDAALSISSEAVN